MIEQIAIIFRYAYELILSYREFKDSDIAEEKEAASNALKALNKLFVNYINPPVNTPQ